MKIAIIALALPLAGCFQPETNFEHCERNGHKIGTVGFEACLSVLDARDAQKASDDFSAWEAEQRERKAALEREGLIAAKQRLEAPLERKAAKMRAAQ